jgi:hypothetical protein
LEGYDDAILAFLLSLGAKTEAHGSAFLRDS